MREIKFKRAHFKDEDKKQFSHFTEWGVGINHTVFQSPSSNNFALYVEDCQFTGLKDSTGKEIYEGDILDADDYLNGKHWFKGVVCFRDASFYIDSKKGITYFRWIDYEFEIIGNIHENPELL